LSISVHKDLKIIITQGDYGLIRVSILQDGEPSPFTEGDTIRFVVKEFPSAPVTLIEKEVMMFQNGVAEIIIESADTAALKIKTYIYGIQWIDEGDNVRTIVPGAEFGDQYPQFEIIAGL